MECRDVVEEKKERQQKLAEVISDLKILYLIRLMATD